MFFEHHPTAEFQEVFPPVLLHPYTILTVPILSRG